MVFSRVWCLCGRLGFSLVRLVRCLVLSNLVSRVVLVVFRVFSWFRLKLVLFVILLCRCVILCFRVV